VQHEAKKDTKLAEKIKKKIQSETPNHKCNENIKMYSKVMMCKDKNSN
jgi:hypothetical protein